MNRGIIIPNKKYYPISRFEMRLERKLRAEWLTSLYWDMKYTEICCHSIVHISIM